ncbi:MAG: hypothetical protein LBF27_30275 [Sphingobacterium sp.]|nr:hypothetical protein [Sphingobacterium sp.]
MINKNIANKFALAAFLALGTLAVTSSCSKNNSQTEEIVPEGKNQVIVRIAGLNEGDNNSSIGTKGSTNNKKSNENSLKFVEGDSFDALIGVTNSSPISSGLKASNGLQAAATPLAPTTTYSIYLYKKNSDNTTYTFVKSVPLTAGAAGTIDLANGAYKWLAVSYNNTDVLPIGATATTVPTSTTLDLSKDILIASSTSDLVINGNSVPLNITFNRVFSTVTVEVNTLGMFARMTENPTISVTAANAIKTKTIDFTTGNLTLTNVANLNLTASDFTNVSPVGTEAYQKIATFKTAEQPQLTVNAKVSQLKVKLDDNTTVRNFGATESNQNINITPLGGKNQRVLVGLAESAITYNNVSWARSNLYYRAGGALSTTPYRFYHANPNNPAKEESFFAFRGHLPGRLASGIEANQKDPCTMVYPAGLWKTPTYANLQTMTSQQGLLSGLLGALLGNPATPNTGYGTNYIEYTPTIGSATGPYSSTPNANRLRFNYNGLQSNVSLVSGLIDVQLGNVGTTAAFWSIDRVADLSIIEVGAWGYIGRTQDPVLGGPRSVASRGAGALNIDLLDLGLVGSGFMNVRCVRDATFAAKSAVAGYNPYPNLTNL